MSTGSALLGLGCTGDRGGSKRPDSPRELKLYGTGTLDIGKNNWEQLRKELGITLSFTDNGNDTGPVITQMIAGNAATDYDLGGLQGGAERELAAAGVILPWDLDKIPNWNSVWDWVRNPKTSTNMMYQDRRYGIPVVVNADSIIYRPKEAGEVDSYAAVFDPKFKGRTSMEDAWINSVIFTAIYLREAENWDIVDPGNLTSDELGRVMEFLIKKKKDGQFRKFWNGWEDGLRLIETGEVIVMTGWEPIVYAAREKGVDVKYAVPKEGYEGWSNDLILHTGARDRSLIELAHEFVNWELDGYYGGVLATLRGYVVPTDKALTNASKYTTAYDPKQVEQIVQNVQNKIQSSGKLFWQNVRPVNYKEYEDWWSKLRSA